MSQTGCARRVVGCLPGRCRTFALGALIVLSVAAPVALAAPRWRPDTPMASHAMLYLDAPYGFKQSMFEQSAGLRASRIRVDLALSAVCTADGSAHWERVDEVMALALAYRLRPVGILLATPRSSPHAPRRPTLTSARPPTSERGRGWCPRWPRTHAA